MGRRMTEREGVSSLSQLYERPGDHLARCATAGEEPDEPAATCTQGRACRSDRASPAQS